MKLGFKTLGEIAVAALAGAALTACASHPPPPPAATGGPRGEAGPPQGGYEGGPPSSVQRGPIPGSEQDFVINIGDRVYFDFDQASIRADAQPLLQAQAGWLQRYPQIRVRIEGNADERGTREYNFALGARRADAVRDFLAAHGVAAGRISTISYGKEQPIDGGQDDAAWAKNRNAHTAIVEGAR
jgi:peptidoglycan-associated lipoprotein